MTTPYPPQGATGASYSSPIPIRKATLGDALASEWTKIRSVRSTMWTLGAMAILLVGLSTIIAFFVGESDPELGEESVLGLAVFGVLMSSLCVITLGVLTITSEYGTGMIRTTLTACPSRARVLAAKAIVFFLVVFTVTFVLTLVVSALAVALVDQAPAPSGGDWARATLGISLYLAFLGLISLAMGTMIRHSAGAITAMLGTVLVPLVAAMFMSARSLEDLQRWLLEYSIPNQLAMIYDVTAGRSGPQGWESVGIVAVLAALALGGAYAVLEKRDV